MTFEWHWIEANSTEWIEIEFFNFWQYNSTRRSQTYLPAHHVTTWRVGIFLRPKPCHFWAMPGKIIRCVLRIWIRSESNCNFAESRHFEALRGKIVPCALDIWMTVWLWLNFAANLDGVATAHRLSAYMRFKFTRDFQLHHNNRPQQRGRDFVYLRNYCWAMLGKVCATVGNARKTEIFSFWWLFSLLKSESL